MLHKVSSLPYLQQEIKLSNLNDNDSQPIREWRLHLLLLPYATQHGQCHQHGTSVKISWMNEWINERKNNPARQRQLFDNSLVIFKPHIHRICLSSKRAEQTGRKNCKQVKIKIRDEFPICFLSHRMLELERISRMTPSNLPPQRQKSWPRETWLI